MSQVKVMRKFYVYVLLDQRVRGEWIFREKVFNFKPFYVGKGSNDRISRHFNGCMLKRKSMKNSIIKAIKNETGNFPLYDKVFAELEEKTSFQIEEAMIQHFGRLDIGTGILSNHTNGGEGQSGATVKHKKRVTQIYQYSLDGVFMKKWDSYESIEENLGISTANIPTSIKRSGTHANFIWSFEYLGDRVNSKIKYQMPNKWNKVEQIDRATGEILNTFSSIKEAGEHLNLTKNATNKIIDAALNKRYNKTSRGFLWRVYDC